VVDVDQAREAGRTRAVVIRAVRLGSLLERSERSLGNRRVAAVRVDVAPLVVARRIELSLSRVPPLAGVAVAGGVVRVSAPYVDGPGQRRPRGGVRGLDDHLVSAVAGERAARGDRVVRQRDDRGLPHHLRDDDPLLALDRRLGADPHLAVAVGVIGGGGGGGRVAVVVGALSAAVVDDLDGPLRAGEEVSGVRGAEAVRQRGAGTERARRRALVAGRRGGGGPGLLQEIGLRVEGALGVVVRRLARRLDAGLVVLHVGLRQDRHSQAEQDEQDDDGGDERKAALVA